MLLTIAVSALLFKAAAAVFADEAYSIDYHYALLGEPQESTTFFHRPNPDSRASLLYTLSKQSVVGALNPKDGAVVWRHLLHNASNTTFLRAAEGADTLVSGVGREITAWSAADGKLVWRQQSPGELQDLRVLDFGDSKDTIALSAGEQPLVIRLDAATGVVKWEHKIDGSDTPYQVTTSTTHAYLVLLHKTLLGYYKLKVVSLDTTTGQKLDEYTLSSENELATADTIFTAGGNTAAPVIAWTDTSHSLLKVNLLGSKSIASFNTKQGKTVRKIVLHAPGHANSLTHFLVHYQGADSNWADVFHIDVKSSKIEKAYTLPELKESSTFSISSSDANVYFTRTSYDEVLTVSSASHGILGRWPRLSQNAQPSGIEFAKTELSVRGDSIPAIRSAIWLTTGELVLHRNGVPEWTRPEALADIVKAEFATSAPVNLHRFRKVLAPHDNPIVNFAQRLSSRLEQIKDVGLENSAILQSPGSWFKTLQLYFFEKDASQDFGFRKAIRCTTRKGLKFSLTTSAAGSNGWEVLPVQEFDIANDQTVVIPEVDARVQYKQSENSIAAYTSADARPLWTFVPKEHEQILSIITRPEDDPVASIGHVLGNRDVLYKYLNPNLALIATTNAVKRSVSFHIIDTVSGGVLYASTHLDVDLSLPVTSSLSENWFAYSFTTDSTGTSSKGHLLVGGELFESLHSNDRGILDASSNFSSLASSDKPTVLTQTYHISEPISRMAVTSTRQGITTKQLLIVLPESNSILGIPRGVLDPRRPNREPTKQEQMEGLVKYQPHLQFDPRWSLNHKREVLGVRDVITSPALLESTSLVFAYGLDVFTTRLSPSFNFDMLGKDFNKVQMLSTVAALFVATLAVGPLVSRAFTCRWRNTDKLLGYAQASEYPLVIVHLR